MEFIAYLAIMILIFLGFKLFISKKREQNRIMNLNSSKYYIPKEIKYQIVESIEHLNKIVNNILDNEINIVGIDTEYYRGDEYHGQLCILQISFEHNNKTEVYIIDVLKIEKIKVKESLEKLLHNNKIEKVFHACMNDIEWIYDEYQLSVVNIFDTQEGYAFNKRKNVKVGLNDLLNEYFSLGLSKHEKKAFQKSNWKKRPLSEDQLRYAAMDSYYLVKLRNIMKKEINLPEKGFEFFKQSLEEKIKKRLTISTRGLNRRERLEHNALKYFTANLVKYDADKTKTIQQMYLEIFKINEEYGREKNINTEKLLNIKLIYKLVNKVPKDREELIKK